MDVKLISRRPFPVHSVISAGLYGLQAASMLILVLVRNWVRYCFVNWGLVTVTTTDGAVHAWIDSPAYFQRVHDTLCAEFQPYIEKYCYSFCEVAADLELAGIAMTISVSAVFCLSLVYMSLFIRQASGQSCQSMLAYYGIWAAPLLYIGGLTLYLSLGNVFAIADTEDEYENVTAQGGLTFAFVNVGLVLFPAIYSYTFTIGKFL